MSEKSELISEKNQNYQKKIRIIIRQIRISERIRIKFSILKINELQKELRRLSQQLNSVATSIQPTTIRPDGNRFYPPPHFQRYMNNEKQQSQCNGKSK